jgi:hypothetical protein
MWRRPTRLLGVRRFEATVVVSSSRVELPTKYSSWTIELLTLDPEERRQQLHRCESQETRLLYISFQAIMACVASGLLHSTVRFLDVSEELYLGFVLCG